MSRSQQAARPARVDGDSVRREAYERAMQTLNGRPGVASTLTPAQRNVIENFDGPEIIGNRDRLRRRNADAS
jgi:hypothetical protein